jgi:ketosteroid isomerase-like protein
MIGYTVGATGGGILVSTSSPASRRVVLAGAALAMVGSARAQPSDDPAQLLALMERYAAGLRWGAADGLVGLYTSDGVFIRDDQLAAVGTEALRAAYRQMFATQKIDLAFEIRETEVAGDMAWLRATSGNRSNSVVIFRRTPAGWKIRCLVYNATKPQ